MSICISCKKNNNDMCQKLGINALGMKIIDECINYKKDKKFISKEPIFIIKSNEMLEEKYKHSDMVVAEINIDDIVEWFENLKYKPLNFLLNEGNLKYSFDDVEYFAHFKNNLGDCTIELWKKKYNQEFIFLMKSLVRFNEDEYKILPLKYLNEMFLNLNWTGEYPKIEKYSKMVLAQLYYVDYINLNKNVIIRENRNLDKNSKNVTTHIYEIKPNTIIISDNKYSYVNEDDVIHLQKQIERKTDSWNVVGHYRHLKNGKIIYIKPYAKGQGKKIPHKYKIC